MGASRLVSSISYHDVERDSNELRCFGPRVMQSKFPDGRRNSAGELTDAVLIGRM